jgi:hypothetical protein
VVSYRPRVGRKPAITLGSLAQIHCCQGLFIISAKALHRPFRSLFGKGLQRGACWPRRACGCGGRRESSGFLWFLTFDKPETLSDNDVRLPRPETHPRNGQKSPFCGEDSLTDTDGVKRTTAHADGGAVGVWSATHFRGVVILSLHPIVLSDVRQGVVHPLRRSRGCAEGGAGNRLTHDARTDNCVGRGHRAQGAIPATADSPSEKLIAKDANGPAGHR